MRWCIVFASPQNSVIIIELIHIVLSAPVESFEIEWELRWAQGAFQAQGGRCIGELQ